jgi:hypothetical protein
MFYFFMAVAFEGGANVAIAPHFAVILSAIFCVIAYFPAKGRGY